MFERGHNSKHLATLAAGAALLAVLAFGAGYAAAQRAAVRDFAAAGAPDGVDLSPLWKAWRVIDEKFVPAAVATTTPVATTTAERNEQRIWGMIEGLAASLGDPYTFYLKPQENKQFTADMSGEFTGVGMEIAVRKSILTVVSPLSGTPADRAGIRSGDQVLKIDGVSTDGLDVDAAVMKIRGPKGTVVVLTLYREGWGAPRDIKVTRDVISVPTVTTTARPDGIFVIKLMTFTANSPELFRGALREFVQSGNTKLILDLRRNPGGYLEAAVSMASWYLPPAVPIVTEDYAGHESNIVHRSLGYDVFTDDLKMVILVDKGTASAAEILADALRHYGVAKLVGSPTFGKGSVQELVEITPDTSLKITVARWLGPDGKQIPITGIVPDVKVELSEADAEAGRDPQMDKAVEIVNSL